MSMSTATAVHGLVGTTVACHKDMSSQSFVRMYSVVSAFCWLLTRVNRIAQHCSSLGEM